jgi:hypothetical protein
MKVCIEYFCLKEKILFLFFIKVAIPYNTITKQIGREVKTAGLHVGSPGFTLIIFPSVFTSMEFHDISVCYLFLIIFFLSIKF